jgi:hypothetical protein
MNNNPESELALVYSKLLFVNDDKEKYGKSIAVEIKDEDEKTVNDWAKANGLKDKNGNDLKVIENEKYGYKYFYFRPTKATEYTDVTGTERLSFEDLTEDSTISLTAMAVPYEAKDEQGKTVERTTYRLMGVIVHNAMANVAKESTQRLLDKVNRMELDAKNEQVDLSDIPF